jgi:hypothetical protein
VKSPQPSTPAEPDAVERHGNWLVLGADVTGKRIACKCADCGHCCAIGAEALEFGDVFCSGCAERPHSAKPDVRPYSLATGLAGAERWDAKKRRAS